MKKIESWQMVWCKLHNVGACTLFTPHDGSWAILLDFHFQVDRGWKRPFLASCSPTEGLARFPVVHGVLHNSHPTVRIASYAFREPFKRQSIETRQGGTFDGRLVGPHMARTRMEFMAKASADIHAILFRGWQWPPSVLG